MSDERITVRLGPEFAGRLDAIAALRGLQGRSEAVRSAIEEATADVERREPPSRHELLCIAGEKARAGSIAAIRLLLEELDYEDPEPDDFISRLAARRNERLAHIRRRASGGLSDVSDSDQRDGDSASRGTSRGRNQVPPLGVHDEGDDDG
jgi:Arc/MetJ-type ribon-helix-helix transcriptional regulator